MKKTLRGIARRIPLLRGKDCYPSAGLPGRGCYPQVKKRDRGCYPERVDAGKHHPRAPVFKGRG